MDQLKRTAMTSRERILAAGRGLPVDRLPVFYWLNPHACCKLMAEYQPYNNRFWNTTARFLWNRFHTNGEQNAPYLWRLAPLLLDGFAFATIAEYAYQMGSDFAVFYHSTPFRFARLALENGHIVMRDLYGARRSIGSGIYADNIDPPIKALADLKGYKFPDMRDDSRYDYIRKMRRKYPDKGLAASVFGAFDIPQETLFGTERFLTMLVDYPDEMQAFLKRWTDNEIEVVRRSVKAGADIMFIGDDYGYNHRTFLSPRMWKKMIYPHLKRLIDQTHAAGALALLHSCGYQMTLLDAYVEAGLDMLQAFQPLAGNDFAAAYATYGDKLTFITGIDTQRGESMTPQEFRDDIRQAYAIGRQKQGFVLGMTHMLQHTMPMDNVHAIFDSITIIHDGVFEN